MKKLSKHQKIFNKVYIGLARQGFKRSDDDGNCAMRGADGRRCAIGQLIPNRLFNEKFNYGTSVDELPKSVLAYIIGNSDIASDTDFLHLLMSAHDDSHGAKDMKENLIAFAGARDLTVPTLPTKR